MKLLSLFHSLALTLATSSSPPILVRSLLHVNGTAFQLCVQESRLVANEDVAAPPTCVLTLPPPEARSVACEWPIAFFWDQSAQVTHFVDPPESACPLSITTQPTAGCIPSCEENGRCRSGFKNGHKVFWCSCAWGWGGRGCRVERQAPWLRYVAASVLLLSNAGALISVYLLVTLLIPQQKHPPSYRSQYCPQSYYNVHSPKLLCQPLSIPSLKQSQHKRDVWRFCVQSSGTKPWHPGAGRRLMLILGSLLLLTTGSVSVAYHACDHLKICFLPSKMPPPPLRRETTGPFRSSPGNFVSDVFFNCLESKTEVNPDNYEACLHLTGYVVRHPVSASLSYYRDDPPLTFSETTVGFDHRYAALQHLDYVCALLTLLYVCLQCGAVPAIVDIPLLGLTSVYFWWQNSVPNGITLLGLAAVALPLTVLGLVYDRRFQARHRVSFEPPGLISSSLTTTAGDTDDGEHPIEIRHKSITKSSAVGAVAFFCAVGLFLLAILGWVLGMWQSSHYWFWHSVWHIGIESTPGCLIYACLRIEAKDKE
eukprot:Protomagalhaensia_sp_Gyna_25__2631@NODE_24_length_7526_cov_33_797783_g17_i0_p1_GENE_NODE_24_length_7526_cov_33_797783_g17_i0NODE_24_length_7526_cov_33_797783_g17_i0_p1_ORF_typecomplete_len538_score57_05DUF3522/PF12036_8/3_2e03DUF3522/PF12036_8/0_65DUF3522/PF12036_8/9_8e05DUF1461/PF07314_11/4_9e03DUF1461/PF07314_11/0_011DUF1461/PF07314_11/4e02DUF3844/PF12955_7/0_074CDPOH_P_transf/PF01066_21/5_5e02CDPOH_P_transf/PF01066_21/1_5DUF872/PF05915_12/7_2e02DUF872/PF05915_12/14DUF872/PF05915_12/1_9e02EGF/